MASARYAQLSDNEPNDIELDRRSAQTPTIVDEATSHNNQHGRPESRPATVDGSVITATSTSHDGTRPSGVELETDLDESTLRLRTLTSLSASYLEANPARRAVSIDESIRRLSTGDRIKYSFSPHTHHSKYAESDIVSLISNRHQQSLETARVYGFWRQTRRLWRLAATEWLATAALCGTFIGILSYFDHQPSMSEKNFYVFNTVTTSLTFLLGVNLTASMRSYAKMLRWKILSLHWQPLESFDLVLRCDSLMNVCKIAWSGWKHKSRRLRFATVAMASMWLFATLALTLAVGMIGLAYSIDPSDTWVETVPGLVQITDFSKLQTTDSTVDTAKVQSLGEAAINVTCLPYASSESASCYTDHKGVAKHWLTAWNPQDLSISMNSWYATGSTARCDEFAVLNGGSGNATTIVVDRYNKNSTVRITFNTQYVPGPGGIVAWASRCDNCETNRDTFLAIFIAKRGPETKPQYFECTNRVWSSFRLISQNESWVPAPPAYQFNNATARILAGAVGWTGDIYIGVNSTWQGMVYKNFSLVTRFFRNTYGGSTLSTANVSDFIASYTVKTIGWIDSRGGGLDQYTTAEGDIPIRSQTLSVKWLYANLLLVGIPTGQLIACVLVFALANRAVIKDDSPLAMAKLYWSLLEKYGLGQRGCMLRTDEIVKYIGKESGDGPRGPMVIYGWKETDQRDDQEMRIGHLDVYEQDNEELENAPADTAQSIRDRQRVKNKFGRASSRNNLFD